MRSCWEILAARLFRSLEAVLLWNFWNMHKVRCFDWLNHCWRETQGIMHFHYNHDRKNVQNSVLLHCTLHNCTIDNFRPDNTILQHATFSNTRRPFGRKCFLRALRPYSYGRMKSYRLSIQCSVIPDRCKGTFIEQNIQNIMLDHDLQRSGGSMKYVFNEIVWLLF